MSNSQHEPFLVFELSRAEKEVVYWMARGLTDIEIGEKLYKSVATIRSQGKSLRKKLKVHTRGEVASLYWKAQESTIRHRAKNVVDRWKIDFPHKGARPVILAELMEELEEALRVRGPKQDTR